VVFEALEGVLGLVKCVDFPDSCARSDSCATREVYLRIHEAIIGVLEDISLAELHQRQIELGPLFAEPIDGDDLCAGTD